MSWSGFDGGINSSGLLAEFGEGNKLNKEVENEYHK